MNRNDLRRVDMNLLVIFETLMFEKNLTHYAACALIEGSSQLRADDPPFDIVLSELSMVWNGVNDNDPAERWLRSRIYQHMSAPLAVD